MSFTEPARRLRLVINPNDIEQRTDEIRRLISSDKVDRALIRLMDFVRDFSDDREHLNEVTVISRSYRSVDTAERQNRLIFSAAQEERTKLLYQALALLDTIVESLSLEAA